jgi:hypothetical protein
MAPTKKKDTAKSTKGNSKRQRSASVEDVPDEEPTHQGGVLDTESDVIMVEVDSESREKSPCSVHTVDDEDEEEKMRECPKAGMWYVNH